MANVHLHSVDYFMAPGNYFWKWTDNGEVIEWANNNKTICFRQELIDVLSELEEGTAPPLSAVVLALAACKTDFGKEEIATLRHHAYVLNLEPDPARDKRFDMATGFLSTLPHLPANLRSHQVRAHLMNLIFRRPHAAGFKPVGLKTVLQDFTSGKWQHQYLNQGPSVSTDAYLWHLSYFEEAKREMPLFGQLVAILQTGISEVPQAANIDVPEPASGSLFDQLAQHPELSPLARLAERLIPVLNIPLHTQGSGHEPFGGISDITNRGNYDKLLLSELAHDDLSLTARLVNGEALYYRREEPPDKPTKKRVILIDATLKMWGIPRLYAMAAALAFAHNLKGREELTAYMMEGWSWVAASLTEVKGIQLAMGVLHHALHCGLTLEGFFTEEALNPEDEVVLVTEAQSLRNGAFIAAYSKIRDRINYTIAVTRSGEIEFRESIKGRSKILGSAKLSLQDILEAPAKVSSSAQANAGEFYGQSPKPLLLVKSVNIVPLAYHILEAAVLVINKNHQVLVYTGSSKGATELLEFIEKGEYRILSSSKTLSILVFNKDKQLLKLYVLSENMQKVRDTDFSASISAAQSIHIKDNRFYVRSGKSAWCINIDETMASGKLIKLSEKELEGFEMVVEKFDPPAQQNNIYRHLTSRFANYSPMFRTKNLYINRYQELAFGSYELKVVDNGAGIRFKESTLRRDGSEITADESFYVPQYSRNNKLRFSLRCFNDGSEVQSDPRGLVHLKSADPSLPQVSLVFVSGCNTACWASDGKYCGEQYFHAPHLHQQDEMPVDSFYFKYIGPFIQHITQNATATQA